MNPSDRRRSTPDEKRYTNQKISNRGQAQSPHSEFKKPKISDRELSESPVSEYIDPKISDRASALPPNKEYTDPKISSRALSVFGPNNYDDKISERANGITDNSKYNTDISKRGLALNNKKDSVEVFLSNSISKPNPHKEYKGPAIPRQPEYFRDSAKAKNMKENDVGLGYDGNGKPSYNVGKLEDKEEYEGRISDRRIAESKPPTFYSDRHKKIKENYVTVGKDLTNPNYKYILTDLGEDIEGKFTNHISDRRPSITKRNPYKENYSSDKFDNADLYESMAPDPDSDLGVLDTMNLGELMGANNLFSRDQINKQKYTKFNRFGFLDPYNGLQKTREYLFFTKPNLHIMNCGVYANDPVEGPDGHVLADGIRNNNFFADLYDRYPEVIYQLESGYTPKESGYSDSPFMNLLSNCVDSSLDVPNITAREIETATNMYGTSINYRGSGYKSDEDIDISLEFTDSKYGELYMLLRAYEEYSRLKDDGLVTPPPVGWTQRTDAGSIPVNMANQNEYANGKFPFTRSHKYKELHDRFSIYKFIVDEDGETILFWAKYIGCYFNTVPRDAYSDLRDANGLKYTVDIKCPFIRDMDPIDLYGFNALIDRYKPNKGDKLDIWLPKSVSSGIFEGKIDGRWASTPYIICDRPELFTEPTYKWLAPKNMKYIYKLAWFI